MKEKGFTLVEVVIAMAIAGVMAVVFVPLLTAQFKNIYQTGDKSYATYTAVEKAEEEIKKVKAKDPANPPSVPVLTGEVKIPDLGVDEEVDTIKTKGEKNGQESDLTLATPKDTPSPAPVIP